MPRQPRKFSNSQIYHVIFKGIDNQEIFYDDTDRLHFLEKLKDVVETEEFEVYAYCLMINHVHIIMKVDDAKLSKILKIIIMRYVLYFNKKYKRIGPLVQDRFRSKNVENLNYFLEVCRYVHQNPEKAGICSTAEYKWSSYQEYMGTKNIINEKVLLHYFHNDINEFVKYTNKIDNLNDMLYLSDYEILGKLDDEEVINIIMKQFNIASKEDFPSFFKLKSIKGKRECVAELKKIHGTNITQLARITRLSRKLFI